MAFKQLRREEDAVSPVIGVILMVAITVILAAVIASFVLGLGDTTSQAPQFSIECDVTNDVITHAGGDDVESDNLAVDGTDLTDGTTFTAGTDIFGGSAADSGTVTEDTQITWSDPAGGSSSIVAEC